MQDPTIIRRRTSRNPIILSALLTIARRGVFPKALQRPTAKCNRYTDLGTGEGDGQVYAEALPCHRGSPVSVWNPWPISSHLAPSLTPSTAVGLAAMESSIRPSPQPTGLSKPLTPRRKTADWRVSGT